MCLPSSLSSVWGCVIIRSSVSLGHVTVQNFWFPERTTPTRSRTKLWQPTVQTMLLCNRQVDTGGVRRSNWGQRRGDNTSHFTGRWIKRQHGNDGGTGELCDWSEREHKSTHLNLFRRCFWKASGKQLKDSLKLFVKFFKLWTPSLRQELDENVNTLCKVHCVKTWNQREERTRKHKAILETSPQCC